MPYIIDGHNLIPKIPGLALRDLDDELQLVEMLQEFCRLSRKKVDVYFDNAMPGRPSVQTFGSVIAHFARAGQSADQAIHRKLSRLGNEARNWTVVSSDRQVQVTAKATRATVIKAEAFAKQMVETLEDVTSEANASDKPSLSPEEVDEWLELFGADNEGL